MVASRYYPGLCAGARRASGIIRHRGLRTGPAAGHTILAPPQRSSPMKIPILIGVLMLLGMVLLREMGTREVAAGGRSAHH